MTKWAALKVLYSRPSHRSGSPRLLWSVFVGAKVRSDYEDAALKEMSLLADRKEVAMKEIEKRVFLTDEQYNSLLVRFKVQSEQPERQVTTYYKAEGQDLRLMQTAKYVKFLRILSNLKKGGKFAAPDNIKILCSQIYNYIIRRILS